MTNEGNFAKLLSDHWKFRLWAAESVAAEMDAKKFGIKSMHLIGSVKRGNPGPESDIDLLIHFDGNSDQRSLLLAWLDGWSRSLDEINFLITGRRTGGLLDIHLISDEDIRSRTSFAILINSPTDAARQLKMGQRAS